MCRCGRRRRVFLAARGLLLCALLSMSLVSCNWRTEVVRMRDSLNEQAGRASRELRRLGDPMVRELRGLGREIGEMFGALGR
jgi:hypothetical protein